MRILAIIPARGGSKGIPRKNIRLMAGKPLIAYAISNALSCTAITDTVVSSDDTEILSVAQMYGAIALSRSAALADDAVTLDPVIFDAVKQMEARTGKPYDIVVTLQPTSPVLRSKTLNDAISDFIKHGAETYISAVNRPHLAWGKNEAGYYPLYAKRLNRQQLPPDYAETGAFLITRREFITENSRMGNRVSVYEVSECESVDIDSDLDWIACETILKRKKIVLRADGYAEIGMGHIYHCIRLAFSLIGHEIMLVTRKDCAPGVIKLQESNLPLTVVDNDAEFFRFLETFDPDIVVNDCLDTTEAYVQALKKLCPRVVTVEDLGEGARLADVVINALYDGGVAAGDPHIYSGEKYVSLRDEFLIAQAKPFSSEVREVLVLFGGTDPGNFTVTVYRLALEAHRDFPNIHFTFIAGSGYDCESNGIVSRECEHITVVQNTNHICAYMNRADLAFTSQGRTVYELAVLGVPSIVIAQNAREQMHTFAQMENGFFNLGLGSNLSYETLNNTFRFLVNTPLLRRSMRELMLKHELCLKNGTKSEINLILGE